MTAGYLIYLVLLSIVLITGLLSYKKSEKAFRYLTFFVCVTLISEITTRIVLLYTPNNSPVYHIYVSVLYVIYGLIYFNLFEGPLRKVIIYSMPFVLLLAILNLLFLQPYSVFPSNIILIVSVLIILFALLYFRQLLLNPRDEPLIKEPAFWFNTASLFFYTTTFLFWSFFNYFINHQLNITLLTTFIFYSNLIYYTMLGIALFVPLLNNKKYG